MCIFQVFVIVFRGCQEVYSQGNFGIPSSYYGCPDVHTKVWQNGFIHLKPGESQMLSWSEGSHLYGVKDDQNVKLSICSAHTGTVEIPSGPLCVFQMDSSCPEGI